MPIHIESNKDTLIHPSYLEPGSMGDGIVTPGRGMTTVFLDLEFRNGYQEGMPHPRLTYSSEPTLKLHYGHLVHKARSIAQEATGTRYTARFYERVLTEILGGEIDIKHIMTGVSISDGYFYHDLGYLAATGARGSSWQ